MLRMNDPNWAPPPSAVVELASDNFTSWVKNKDIALVMWYAPWCKHCKQVKPGKLLNIFIWQNRFLKYSNIDDNGCKIINFSFYRI